VTAIAEFIGAPAIADVTPQCGCQEEAGCGCGPPRGAKADLRARAFDRELRSRMSAFFQTGVGLLPDQRPIITYGTPESTDAECEQDTEGSRFRVPCTRSEALTPMANAFMDAGWPWSAMVEVLLDEQGRQLCESRECRLLLQEVLGVDNWECVHLGTYVYYAVYDSPDGSEKYYSRVYETVCCCTGSKPVGVPPVLFDFDDIPEFRRR